MTRSSLATSYDVYRTASRNAWRPLAFHPSYVSGLVLKMDAAQTASVALAEEEHAAGGFFVNSWKDVISGNVAVNTGDARPRYTTDAGRPVVYFERASVDTTDDTLPDATPSASITALPLSIFVVCTRIRDVAVADRTFLLGSSASLNAGITLTANPTADEYRWIVGGGGASSTLLAGTHVANGNIWGVTLASSGTATRTYCDGVAGATTTRVCDLSVSPVLQVATQPSGNSYRGGVFEILIYNSVLSTADRQAVEGYLAHKWLMKSQLAATHPYKTVAP